MDQRIPLKYRQNTQSPKYLRHQQQFKTNPKRLRRTSFSDIESINDAPIPIHESLEATTTIELTQTYYEKYDLLNLTILLSFILSLLIFILIIITFIFPNWLLITIPTIRKSNVDTIDSNLVLNNKPQNNTNPTMFDIGLWELKFQKLLQIINSQNQILTFNSSTTTSSSVSTSILSFMNQTNDKYSLLWLSEYNEYSRELTRIIGFDKSTVFTVEILEILHLIFTFLVIILLFVNLCTCRKDIYSKNTKLWHFVSFSLSLISFFMGLGTLIQFTLWKQHKTTSYKIIEFNWCFWCLVAEISTMFFVIVLIKINLIFACKSCCDNEYDNKQFEKPLTSANSRSSAALINKSKTTPNISTIGLNNNNYQSTIQKQQQQQFQQQQQQIQQQIKQHSFKHQQEVKNENLIKPSSLLGRNQQHQQSNTYYQQTGNDYINDRMMTIPRPNLTSSNINIRNAAADNSNNNSKKNINSDSNINRFDNYIYYNGSSTYRTNN